MSVTYTVYLFNLKPQKNSKFSMFAKMFANLCNVFVIVDQNQDKFVEQFRTKSKYKGVCVTGVEV